MSDENPFNYTKFREPISDGVLVNDMPLLRHYVDNNEIFVDITMAGHYIRSVREQSEGARGRKVERGEITIVQCTFTQGIITYGRCFVENQGRRKLSEGEIKRWGGKLDVHEELMQRRNEVIAHREKVHSRTEVFAMLDVRPGIRKLKGFNCLESWYPLPSIERLQDCEKHIDAMAASLCSELENYSNRLGQLVSAEHMTDLYELLASGRPWPRA